MKIRQKLSGKIRRTGREADLGQKEAKLEKNASRTEIAAWLASDHSVGPKPVPLTEGHVSRRRRKQSDQSLEVGAAGANASTRGPPT